MRVRLCTRLALTFGDNDTLFHHRRLEDAHHHGGGGLVRAITDDMRPVAAITQSLAGLGVLDHATDFDFEFAIGHRETFDGPALMRIRFEHAARFGGKSIPLQPFDGLDPADDRKMALAIVGDENSACRLSRIFRGRARLR